MARSLATVKDKSGRVDVLLHGVVTILTQKLEQKTNLPGLSEGLMPVLEDEIRKHVPPKVIIPKKYKGLANLLSQQISKPIRTEVRQCQCKDVLCGGIGSTCSRCGGIIL